MIFHASRNYNTIRDLNDLSVQLNNDGYVLSSCYGAMLAQMQERVLIQDPAFPEDPTKRIWHPNMLVIFNEAQRAKILDIYNHVVEADAFWTEFYVTDAAVTSTLFNIEPQLDSLVACIEDLVS